MQDREYIWDNEVVIGSMYDHCVVVPSHRMVIARTGLMCSSYRVTDTVARIYEQCETIETLHEWLHWRLAFDDVHLWAHTGGGYDCNTYRWLMESYGPLTTSRIYRYDRQGVYMSESLDVQDQRRLLMLTRCDYLPRDVTMSICVITYSIMISESTMRVVELR